MRCIVDKSQFSIIDSFDTVRVKVNNEKVIIYCYSNRGIKCQFTCKNKGNKSEEGEVIFGAKELSYRLKTMKGDDVSFKNNVISNGKIFHKLPILPDGDNPDLYIDESNLDWSVLLSPNIIIQALDSVSFCVLSRNDRPITNSVSLCLVSDSLTSFGFDGHKLASYKCELELKKFVNADLFIHLSTIPIVKKWMKGKEEVNLAREKSWIYMYDNDSCLFFLQQLIELPQFEKILSFPHVSEVVFDKNELKDALQSLVHTDEGIYFHFKGGKKCNLKCNSTDSHASSAAIVNYSCDSKNLVDFKINGKFILDAIKVITGDTIVLRLGKASEDPVTIQMQQVRCAMAPMIM